jgi:hypothetical protein
MRVFVADDGKYVQISENIIKFLSPKKHVIPNLRSHNCFYLTYKGRIFHFIDYKVILTDAEIEFTLGNSFNIKRKIIYEEPFKFFPLIQFGMIQISPGLLVNLPKEIVEKSGI